MIKHPGTRFQKDERKRWYLLRTPRTARLSQMHFRLCNYSRRVTVRCKVEITPCGMVRDSPEEFVHASLCKCWFDSEPLMMASLIPLRRAGRGQSFSHPANLSNISVSSD